MINGLTRILVLLALVAAVAAGPVSADGATLSGRDVRRALNDAEQALVAGDLNAAAEHCEPVLEALPEGDPRRAEALYLVALSHLQPETPRTDAARARTLLDELHTSHPAHPRSAEAGIALACLDEVGGSRERLELLRRELDGQRRGLDEERRSFEQERLRLAERAAAADGELSAARDEAVVLRREVARLEAELAETRAELTRKSEALEQVKETLVGRRD